MTYDDANMRFIPARAGNSHEHYAVLTRRTVYPRPCGEQVGHQPVLGADVRFIPARAGNSSRRRRWAGRGAVYPRPCGEQMFEAPRASISCGLSPPVRGTVLVTLGARVAGRFIPARAGNRANHPSQHVVVAVYPRPCGEQGGHQAGIGILDGLSPPVRGTAIQDSIHAGTPRFIPARAGNSLNIHDCFIRENRERDFPPNILYEF